MPVRNRSRVAAAPLQLRKGVLCAHDKQLVRITAIVSSSEIHVANIATGDVSCVTASDLKLAALETGSEPKTVPAGELIEQGELDRATEWAQALRALSGLSRVSFAERQAIATKLDVSVRTVDRHLSRYQANPVVASQVNSIPGPAPGTSYLSPTVLSIIDEAYNNFYLTLERRSVSQLCDEISHRCSLAGLSAAPSYASVLKRVKEKDLLFAEKKRRGAIEGESIQKVSLHGLVTKSALEVVQIDHAIVDLIVVSPITRREIGRPWITLAIDVYTRSVVGWHLGFEVPDQTHVGETILHACMPKEKFLRDMDIKLDYPVYGVMKSVHWDNGKSFQAKGIQRQCALRNIDTIVRPIKRPHWGAYIERYIGTFMGQIHMLPGSTFSNTKDRGSYKSQKRAIMSLPELKRWVALEIIKYSHTKHKTLGTSPMQMWNRCWADGSGGVRLPPIISDPREFLLGFLPRVQRVVGRDGGVGVFALKYWDPALSPLINSGMKYDVHYRKDDLSMVWLHHRDQFIDAPISDGAAIHFTYAELLDAKAAVKADPSLKPDTAAWLEAVAAQRKTQDEAEATSRKARRAIAMRPVQKKVERESRVDYTRPAPAIDMSGGRVK